MAYKIDRIYQTDGTELTNALHTTTLASANQMVYDGRYLWVTCGTSGVAIYEFWGAASENERAWETMDELIYPHFDTSLHKKLRLVNFITITATQIKRTTCLQSLAESGATTYTQASGETAYAKVTTGSYTALNAFHIKKCANKMYVTNGSTFSQIFEFNIDTQSFSQIIDVHEVFPGPTFTAVGGTFTAGASYGMNSNLGSANCKLWFVGSSFNDTVAQKLYSYNVLTGAKTATDINVRPSFARTNLTNGHNGYVYVCNYNNLSVQKYSDIDGALAATIRIGNRFPSNIWSGPDRKIWVSSNAGVVSLVDWDDDQVHNSYSSGTVGALAIQSDPTAGNLVWMIDTNDALIRYNINDNTQFDSLTSGDDWSIVPGTYTGAINPPGAFAPTALWMNQSMFFQDASLTTHTLGPYMFLIQAGKLLAWRLDRYLYRENYSTINGQAAVVEGAQQYFGG